MSALYLKHEKSCGALVYRKHGDRTELLLIKHRFGGHWSFPKGHVELGENEFQTALREVKEETGSTATIIKYIGKSQYSFNTAQSVVMKDVHWYLMMSDSYYSKPQREEFFTDSGYYKYHEAYHMLKFTNEKQILENERFLYYLFIFALYKIYKNMH